MVPIEKLQKSLGGGLFRFSSGCFVAVLRLFLLISGSFPLRAQSTFGTITGLIQNPQGLPAPQAGVTIHYIDENSERRLMSDEHGNFTVANLKPGMYSLSAAMSGFANASIPQAKLEPQQILRVTLKLSLSTSAVVEVSNAAEQINTENGVVSDSKLNQELTKMPLNFRAATTGPLAAMALSPQVQQDTQGNIAVGPATSARVGFSVDGISTANVRQNGALQDSYPSSEGISEMKITSFNNNAEYAQIGDVTFTTKSGTNDLRGSLFEYLQNDALDANVYNFPVKAPKRFNTFGGSLGGPIQPPRL